MTEIVQIFRALSCKPRQRILEMLAKRDMSAGEIAAAFDMSQPSVSHHLSVLKNAGLVTDRREGQHIIYSFNPAAAEECLASAFFQKVFLRKR